MSVSGNRPEATDRRKPIIDRRPKPVGIAMISETETALVCSCGAFATAHPRKKVRENKAQRHVDKHHGGQAVWL